MPRGGICTIKFFDSFGLSPATFNHRNMSRRHLTALAQVASPGLSPSEFSHPNREAWRLEEQAGKSPAYEAHSWVHQEKWLVTATAKYTNCLCASRFGQPTVPGAKKRNNAAENRLDFGRIARERS
jgi:hypothetical protein